MSREVEFPHGATVRELAAALAAVPEEDQDKEVDVMFTPMGVERATGYDLPGVIWAFDAFPSTENDPQPTMASWTIRAMDGISTAAEVETLRAFGEFREARGVRNPLSVLVDADPLETLIEHTMGDIAESHEELRQRALDDMVNYGWVDQEGDKYELTAEGLKQLE